MGRCWSLRRNSSSEVRVGYLEIGGCVQSWKTAHWGPSGSVNERELGSRADSPASVLQEDSGGSQHISGPWRVM